MGTALFAGCVQSPLSGKEEKIKHRKEEKWEEEELVRAQAIPYCIKKAIINK